MSRHYDTVLDPALDVDESDFEDCHKADYFELQMDNADMMRDQEREDGIYKFMGDMK
jgi:hypothetical protein